MQFSPEYTDFVHSANKFCKRGLSVEPGGSDKDVTLLYQTEKLEDIRAAQDMSAITRGAPRSNITF